MSCPDLSERRAGRWGRTVDIYAWSTMQAGEDMDSYLPCSRIQRLVAARR